MKNNKKTTPDITVKPKLSKTEFRKVRGEKTSSLNSAVETFNGPAFDKSLGELLSFLDATVGVESPDYLLNKNKAFELIHFRCLGAISNLVQDLHRLPLTTEISKVSGFTELTIGKHLREVVHNPLYKSELIKFQLLRTRILTRLFNLGIAGDLQAAKIFLDSTNPNHEDAK